MKLDGFGGVAEFGSKDKVSPHFAFSEFCHDENSICPPEFYERLMRLAGVLEMLRKESQHKIWITSGYRSPASNRRCGGAPHSQHLRGNAVDFRAVHHVDQGKAHTNDKTAMLHGLVRKNADLWGVGACGWYGAKEGRPLSRIHLDLRFRLPGEPIKTWVK